MEKQYLFGIYLLGICLVSNILYSNGLYCLSCTNVIQPRHCSYLRQCDNHEVCGVRKFLTITNEIRYEVDCFNNESCDAYSIRKRVEIQNELVNKRINGGIKSVTCEECCNRTICNQQGCGEPGIPSRRGTICFSCTQSRDPLKCEHLKVCAVNQVCKIEAEEEFGDQIYTTRCEPKYLCQSTESSLIGKRRIGPCNRCCDSDLCNNHCVNTGAGIKFTPTIANTVKPSSMISKYITKSLYNNTSIIKTTPVYKDIDSTSEEFLLFFQTSFEQLNSVVILIEATMEGNAIVNVPFLNLFKNMSLTLGTTNLELNKSIRGIAMSEENKGILIQSSVPISVVGLNYRSDSNEAFLALPTLALGTKYKTVNVQTLPKSNFSSVVMMGARYNNTIVSIKLNTTGSIQILGRSYKSGDVMKIAIDALNTFVLSHTYDLSGSVVTSNKPIAVTCGNQCTHVLHNYGNCQPLVEFMIPVDSWGYQFVVPRLSVANSYSIKILSAMDTTIINISNSVDHNSYITKANESLVLNTSILPCFIEANKPIYVTLFTDSYSSTNVTALMVSIPAFTHYQTSYNIALPTNDGNKNSLSIIIDTNDFHGLEMDGTSLFKGNQYVEDIVRGSTQLYSIFTVSTKNNSHVINHQIPTVRFGVIVYGTAGRPVYYGYGYPGGMQLRKKIFSP